MVDCKLEEVLACDPQCVDIFIGIYSPKVRSKLHIIMLWLRQARGESKNRLAIFGCDYEIPRSATTYVVRMRAFCAPPDTWALNSQFPRQQNHEILAIFTEVDQSLALRKGSRLNALTHGLQKRFWAPHTRANSGYSILGQEHQLNSSNFTVPFSLRSSSDQHWLNCPSVIARFRRSNSVLTSALSSAPLLSLSVSSKKFLTVASSSSSFSSHPKKHIFFSA